MINFDRTYRSKERKGLYKTAADEGRTFVGGLTLWKLIVCRSAGTIFVRLEHFPEDARNEIEEM